MEQVERERTGIKNLKVGFNKVFGYYIEVSKGQCNLVKDEFGYDRKQTLANCERFTTPLLKEKENIILGAEEKIINLEYKLFMDIREVVKRYVANLQKTAHIISEIDMLQSFSIVSVSLASFTIYLLPFSSVIILFPCKAIPIFFARSSPPAVPKATKSPLTNTHIVQGCLSNNFSNIWFPPGPGPFFYLLFFAVFICSKIFIISSYEYFILPKPNASI